MMAGNIYDVLGSARQGFDDADAMTQTIRRRAAGKRAAPMVAHGDYRGAAEAYGGEGLAGEAGALRGAQEQVEQRDYERGRQQHQDQNAAAEKRAKLLIQVATGLQHVPAGQRLAALKQAYPLFQAAQVDTTPFDHLTEDQLTDDGLHAFVGEVASHWHAMSTPAGMVKFNDQTGESQLAVPAPEKPPGLLVRDENGDWVLNPAYVKAQGALASARRAPPRPHASGGGRPGGGLSGVSTADLIAALRR